MSDNPFVEPQKCKWSSCTETFMPHHWGTVRAKGWFHQKNGDSWCPNHKPAWVTEWRARKAAKQKEGQ